MKLNSQLYVNQNEREIVGALKCNWKLIMKKGYFFSVQLRMVYFLVVGDRAIMDRKTYSLSLFFPELIFLNEFVLLSNFYLPPVVN